MPKRLWTGMRTMGADRQGIDIHADDFGESPHTAEDILDCLRAGKLDSVSIQANMSCFDACAARYRQEEKRLAKKPALSVHLNIMEGHCLSEPGQVPDLVDGNGYFSVPWSRLFFASFLPKRAALKVQLKREFKAQIEKVRAVFPECAPLRLDSHQHAHMIPVAAEALFELIGEEGWEVSYIRDVREPLAPFLKAVSLYGTYRPVNFAKNLILNFCSRLEAKRFCALGLRPMCVWGLVMSGRMDRKRVEKLMPAMVRHARRRGRALELIFHPGRTLPGEVGAEFSQKEAVGFYLSEDRALEKETVLQL